MHIFSFYDTGLKYSKQPQVHVSVSLQVGQQLIILICNLFIYFIFYWYTGGKLDVPPAKLQPMTYSYNSYD